MNIPPIDQSREDRNAEFIERMSATSVADEDAKTGSDKPMAAALGYLHRAEIARQACSWGLMSSMLFLALEQIAEARRCIGGRL